MASMYAAGSDEEVDLKTRDQRGLRQSLRRREHRLEVRTMLAEYIS